MVTHINETARYFIGNDFDVQIQIGNKARASYLLEQYLRDGLLCIKKM